MTVEFDPFRQSLSLSLGNLTVETATDQITIYGDLDIRRDRVGLERARHLRDLLNAVIASLEKEETHLPDEAAPFPPAPRYKNPFI